MKCLKCGAEIQSELRRHEFVTEIVMKCQNCGWSAVTTEMDDIANDLTKYSIVIEPGNTIEKESMRTISRIFGYNILESRKILAEGGIVLNEYAIDIIEIIPQLDLLRIQYHIEPEFPY